MSDITFDSIITRVIPDEKIVELMSTFNITDYTIDSGSGRFTVNKKSQATLPNKELTEQERKFAESLGLYNKK